MQFNTYKTFFQQAFEETLASLAKRAKRLGVEPLEHRLVETVLVDLPESKGGRKATQYVYEVENRLVCLGGWQVHGAVHVEEAPDGVKVATYTGRDEQANAYLSENRTTRCDHCNTNRFRKDSYLLKGTEGKYVMVGSTCIKDFTGHSPKVVELFTGAFDDLEESCRGGVAKATHLPIDLFVKAVRFAVSIDNRFVKSGVMDDEPTWSTALNILTPNAHDGLEMKKLRESFNVYEFDVAPVIEYLRAMNTTSDYAKNMVSVVSSEYVEIRRHPMALLASGVWVYLKALAEAQVKKTEAVSKHLGSIGERITVTATLTKVNWFEGNFGWVGFHKFVDADGNELSWKTGNSPCEIGETVTLKATVKEHTTYNGVFITEVQRAALVTK